MKTKCWVYTAVAVWFITGLAWIGGLDFPRSLIYSADVRWALILGALAALPSVLLFRTTDSDARYKALRRYAVMATRILAVLAWVSIAICLGGHAAGLYEDFSWALIVALACGLSCSAVCVVLLKSGVVDANASRTYAAMLAGLVVQIAAIGLPGWLPVR